MGAAPLAGVRVVDLSRHLPGPLAARLLCDLGARVVKVEEPREGDPVRAAPPFAGPVSSLAALLLAGVESIALDLRQPAAKQVLLALLAEADVLLESFRPGTLARFGLAPAELRKRFPRLVICSISGWGQEGPYSGRAGHDLGYQAVAGALAASGAHPPAVQIADQIGAWSAVTAILAALFERQHSGSGSWIDQALVDAATHANLMGWVAETAGARAVGEPLPLSGALPCYRVYRCRGDGLLAVATLEAKFWQRLCDRLERPDLVAQQLDRSAAAHRQVEELFASRSRDEWIELLAGDDLPVEPVLSPAEALAHPQVSTRGVVDRSVDGAARLRFPALFDGAPAQAAADMPALGEDTERWLDELALLDLPRGRWRLSHAGVGRRRSLLGWLRRRILRRVDL